MPDPRSMPRDLTTAESKQIFTNETQDIINWKGDNFYKACDYLVTGTPDNGASYCIKPSGHKSLAHEDWDGHETLDV